MKLKSRRAPSCLCSRSLSGAAGSSQAAPLGISIHCLLLSQSQTSELLPFIPSTCRGFALPSSFIFSHGNGGKNLVDMLCYSLNAALAARTPLVSRGISDVGAQPQHLCCKHGVRRALPQPGALSSPRVSHTEGLRLWGTRVTNLSPLGACCPPPPVLDLMDTQPGHCPSRSPEDLPHHHLPF